MNALISRTTTIHSVSYYSILNKNANIKAIYKADVEVSEITVSL